MGAPSVCDDVINRNNQFSVHVPTFRVPSGPRLCSYLVNDDLVGGLLLAACGTHDDGLRHHPAKSSDSHAATLQYDAVTLTGRDFGLLCPR